MAETFVADLDAIEQVFPNSAFKSQIANTLSCIRHNIPCSNLSLNYNYTLNIPEDKLRASNPNINGKDKPEDIKVFHYLSNGKFNKADFEDDKSIEKALQRTNLSSSELVFQQKLQIIHHRIKGTDGFS